MSACTINSPPSIMYPNIGYSVGDVRNTYKDISNDISLKGENLNDRLARIEKLLLIPQRNIELEQKYPKLKRLLDEYNETLSAITTWEHIRNNNET